LNKPFRDVARFVAIACIKGRLGTTGLPVIELNFAPHSSQHFDATGPNTAPELVDETGYEEGNAHEGSELPIADLMSDML
jgi:hypothetical protein